MQIHKNQSQDTGAQSEYTLTEMRRDQILSRLKKEGCRITKQRRILLDIILAQDCSSCKEIYYRASAQDSGIGMATVYRMVNTLEKIGAISRKNMYRVSADTFGSKERNCLVELSDHTVCSLTPDMWMDVMRAGLKECGFIADQEIEQIVMQPGA